MKNKTLLQANLLICFIIVAGFIATSIISYESNIGIFKDDVEMVSALSSEGLYNEISAVFAQPVNVALTMANDSLLKEFLEEEDKAAADAKWQGRMRGFLNTYKNKYAYDSVFLVSAETNNYYHFAGIDRVLNQANPENKWYYDALKNEQEYSLNIDNDEATDNSITVFVNCKIKDDSGKTLGIVGVGLRVEHLQEVLERYNEKYGVRAYLINQEGIIQISSDETGYANENLFDNSSYADQKDAILQNKDKQHNFWCTSSAGNLHVVSHFEPNLQWHLVVEKDTSDAQCQLKLQLVRNLAIIALIVLTVLIIIMSVIKRYNARIAELSVTQELEYQRLLHEATEGLYENIFEMDITHNCAGATGTREYFASMGISPDTSYDEAILVIAEKQIKEEYREGYLKAVSRISVFAAYKSGKSNISYEFLSTFDGVEYHWVRLYAQIFYWRADDSVRMLTYRRNIDAEKKREQELLDDVQKDAMTGLYNKQATESLIETELARASDTEKASHAFLVFDVDDFKTVNDTMGHSAGDEIIRRLAEQIKAQFREDDIVGRIGGDEFAVLMKNIGSIEALNQKLTNICNGIRDKEFGHKGDFRMSCSIGVSVFPQNGETYSALYEKADQALYHAKNHGKNSFILFDECVGGYSFRVGQRDLARLMNIATDGLAQYACTDPIKLLYFNSKCFDLFGVSAETAADPSFNPMGLVHPDDMKRVEAQLRDAAREHKVFESSFRVVHQDGHYMTIKQKGFFLNELYKGEFPVFYVMYTKID